MNNKDIVQLTKEQSKLVEENHNLIYDFAYKSNILNIDDWYGILATGLCKAAKYYDKDKGAFSTLVFKCMENELCDVMRRYDKSIQKDTMSYDDELFPKDFPDFSTHNGMYYAIMLDSLSKNLNDKETQVLSMIANGDTQNEIAEKMGCKQQNVSYYVKQIKKKIGHWLID